MPRLISIRFGLKTLLTLFAGVALSAAIAKHLHHSHQRLVDLEVEIAESGRLDVVADYRLILPHWISGVLTEDVQSDFEHLTEADFRFNDLNSCEVEDLRTFPSANTCTQSESRTSL